MSSMYLYMHAERMHASRDFNAYASNLVLFPAPNSKLKEQKNLCLPIDWYKKLTNVKEFLVLDSLL